MRAISIRAVLLAACGMLASSPNWAGDSLPKGSISYFNLSACPTGWAPLTAAKGRFLLPLMAGGSSGGKAGDAMAAGTSETHSHSFTLKINVTDFSYAGVTGCCNKSLTSSGEKSATGTSGAGTLGVPYISLLACLKTQDQDFKSGTPRAGTLVFSADDVCPTGWSQHLSTQGRYMVSLPKAGVAGVTFGGAPLAPQELRNHKHTLQGSIKLSEGNIILGPGCCGAGYAKAGKYSYDVSSDVAVPNVPYVQQMFCRKD
jgi:hypothetical protein